MWPGSAPFAGIIMRFTWNHWVGKAAMHKARITPARSSSHTLYMHMYTLTHTHTLAAQSEPYTICVLRFIMQISCRSRSTFSPQQSLLLLLLLFFTGRLICYCCMACGLKKYFYLIYLWMKWRLLAVAGGCCSGRLGNKGNCLCLCLSLSAVPPLLELLAFSVAGAYRIVT